jgi:hypothetical protein
VESVVALASTRGDVEGLIRKVARLEGELVEAHWARDVARERERVHRLLSSSAEGVQRLMASNTERREQFEELCLLRSWVSSYDFPSSAHCK